MEKRVIEIADCLAKTRISKDNKKCKGRNILDHCLITGEVARSLIKRFPDWLLFLFPSGTELIAAAHDVGKISPAFQKKIYENIDSSSLPEFLLEQKNINLDLEEQCGYHAGVSQLTTKYCNIGKFIPAILGQHHGYSPSLSGYIATDDYFGGEFWQKYREEFLGTLKERLNCNWPKIENPLQASVISGLTTVADWIASGSNFDNPEIEWRSLVESSVDLAGFIKLNLCKNLSFFEIFGFHPRSVQNQLIQCCKSPGIYILEAPMGIGKTEAALYAAYQMMLLDKAKGIYFALPTQLTSDKIYDRMNQFLEQILVPDDQPLKAMLLHSNAWLQNTEMGEEGQPGGSWFQSTKRRILAPFGVGTIDQTLMAVMNVKHGFVRAFGLAGKVVIIDEVHSYDTYTGTILNTLIGNLVKLRCTVIILSATLTYERRKELFLDQSPMNNNSMSNAYPLISTLINDQLHEISLPASENSEINIRLCSMDKEALEAALLKAEQGQYVLWVENTVDEAQAIYKILSANAKELGIQCGLLHSRFLKNDRKNIENLWISLFGKNSSKDRRLQGCILVGTQILEQSIDIDADFLISRICPTDMLLQRLGRLWRHKETLRSFMAKREAWILAFDWKNITKNSEKDFNKTALVYAPYVLYRSLEILSQINLIRLPDHIRILIENTYKEREETGELLFYKNELKEEKDKLKKFALIGIAKAGTTLSENAARTRLSKYDTTEVLLLKSYFHNTSGTTLILLDGNEIYLPKNTNSMEPQKWRNLSIILQNNIVKVADYLAPSAPLLKELSWLENYLYLGIDENGNSMLRISEIKENGELKDSASGYECKYNSKIGYQAQRK